MKSQAVSIRRLNANRENAKKSTGPKTAEGRAASSRNSAKHGLTSKTFILKTEDLDEFNEFRNAYIARFGPRDLVELNLVGRMVHADWNEHRSWSMEHELIDLKIEDNFHNVNGVYVDPPPGTQAALAVDQLAKEPTLPLLQRYAAALSRESRRAFKMLLELRKEVPLLPANTPGETNPWSETNTPPEPKTETTTEPPSTVSPQVPAAPQPPTPVRLTTDHRPPATAFVLSSIPIGTQTGRLNWASAEEVSTHETPDPPQNQR